jgi:hypothetical protein
VFRTIYVLNTHCQADGFGTNRSDLSRDFQAVTRADD